MLRLPVFGAHWGFPFDAAKTLTSLDIVDTLIVAIKMLPLTLMKL
jgi:hypothetical protein